MSTRGLCWCHAVSFVTAAHVSPNAALLCRTCCARRVGVCPPWLGCPVWAGVPVQPLCASQALPFSSVVQVVAGPFWQGRSSVGMQRPCNGRATAGVCGSSQPCSSLGVVCCFPPFRPVSPASVPAWLCAGCASPCCCPCCCYVVSSWRSFVGVLWALQYQL